MTLTRRSISIYRLWRDARGEIERNLIVRNAGIDPNSDKGREQVAALVQLRVNLDACGPPRGWWQSQHTGSDRCTDVRPEIIRKLADGLQVRETDGAAVLRDLARLCGVNSGWQEQWLATALAKHWGVGPEPAAAKPEREVISKPERESEAPAGGGRTTQQMLRDVEQAVQRDGINLAEPVPVATVEALAAEVRIAPAAAVRMLECLRRKQPTKKGAVKMETNGATRTAEFPPEPPDLSPRQQEMWAQFVRLGVSPLATFTADTRRAMAVAMDLKENSLTAMLHDVRAKIDRAANRPEPQPAMNGRECSAPPAASTGAVVIERPNQECRTCRKIIDAEWAEVYEGFCSVCFSDRNPAVPPSQGLVSPEEDRLTALTLAAGFTVSLARVPLARRASLLRLALHICETASSDVSKGGAL